MTVTEGILPTGATINLMDSSRFKPVHISELPESEYQRIVETQKKMLEFRHSSMINATGTPLQEAYAEVVVNGKTVATVMNTGGVQSSNAIGGRIQSILAKEDSTAPGPLGAQERAEILAEALGGVVEKSATAITINEYNNLEKPSVVVDYDAMRDDPLYENLQNLEQARTAFLAQQIAQSNDFVEDLS